MYTFVCPECGTEHLINDAVRTADDQVLTEELDNRMKNFIENLKLQAEREKEQALADQAQEFKRQLEVANMGAAATREYIEELEDALCKAERKVKELDRIKRIDVTIRSVDETGERISCVFSAGDFAVRNPRLTDT